MNTADVVVLAHVLMLLLLRCSSASSVNNNMYEAAMMTRLRIADDDDKVHAEERYHHERALSALRHTVYCCLYRYTKSCGGGGDIPCPIHAPHCWWYNNYIRPLLYGRLVSARPSSASFLLMPRLNKLSHLQYYRSKAAFAAPHRGLPVSEIT